MTRIRWWWRVVMKNYWCKYIAGFVCVTCNDGCFCCIVIFHLFPYSNYAKENMQIQLIMLFNMIEYICRLFTSPVYVNRTKVNFCTHSNVEFDVCLNYKTQIKSYFTIAHYNAAAVHSLVNICWWNSSRFVDHRCNISDCSLTLLCVFVH